MNYEQKYKEALEKARQLCAYPTTKPFISDLQDLFPELKESGDERIRKSLIELFHDTVSNDEIFSDYGLDKTEVLAWLEKQGKQSSNILWHDVSEEPDEKREIFCEWKSSTGTWHSVVFYYADSKAFFDGEGMVQNVVKWTYVNEMLEKQGEQTDIANKEYWRGYREGKQETLDKYAEFEKQGEQKPVEWCSEDEQNLNVCLSYIPHEFLRRWLKDIIHIKYDKPIDMVEPKFHKGEWITIKE